MIYYRPLLGANLTPLARLTRKGQTWSLISVKMPSFKSEYTSEARQEEAARIKEKYPDRMYVNSALKKKVFTALVKIVPDHTNLFFCSLSAMNVLNMTL